MLEVDSSKIEISSKLSRSSELSVEHYQQLLLLSLGSVFPQKTLLAVSCVFQIIALLISLLQMVLAAQFTNNLSGQLNQLQFSLMAYLLIASVIVFLVYLCYIYGIFQPMTLYNADLLNPHLLFYSFKGDMRSLGDQFQDIKRRAEKFFKLSNSFGIYFSDPSQNIWKCVLGIIVNSGQKQQASQFLEQNAKFKERKLQSTRFIGTSFPYVNALTFIFLMHSKIGNFRKMLAETKVPLFRGSFQIYHFNFSPKRIELVNPLNNLSQFQVYQEE